MSPTSCHCSTPQRCCPHPSPLPEGEGIRRRPPLATRPLVAREGDAGGAFSSGDDEVGAGVLRANKGTRARERSGSGLVVMVKSSAD